MGILPTWEGWKNISAKPRVLSWIMQPSHKYILKDHLTVLIGKGHKGKIPDVGMLVIQLQHL